MNKAIPCKFCKTDRHLKWKCMDEFSLDNIWWITCEGCGTYAEAKPTMQEAGENWNLNNTITIKGGQSVY